MSAPLLEAKNLTKAFDGVVAVDGLNIKIEKGEIRGLIGPNGAGKTTSFNLIGGALKPTSGSVSFDGAPLTGKKASEISAMGVVRTFQRTAIFGEFSVLRNIMIARHLHAEENVFQAIFGSGKREEENREAAMDIIKFMGLEEWVDHDAANLPYGFQRTVNVAAALATEPKLLMLDEPVAGMNPVESERMTNLIRKLRDERGITVILVEHDMRTVMGLCDKLTVLDFGKTIAEGSPKEIANNEQVIEAYLGSEDSFA